MGRLRHTDEALCPLCEEKLKTAHEILSEWFRRLKLRYPNVHVSWAWRSAEEQNLMVQHGLSQLSYPHSRHNATRDGKPCSEALDLFQIDEDGIARFSIPFYTQVHAENQTNRAPIAWGGVWKTLSDKDHFEIKYPMSVKT